jgi:hypothetical protein
MLRVLGERHRFQIKRIHWSPQQRYCHIDDLKRIELTLLRNIPAVST